MMRLPVLPLLTYQLTNARSTPLHPRPSLHRLNPGEPAAYDGYDLSYDMSIFLHFIDTSARYVDGFDIPLEC